jgi:F-type H+-transporting ATPase subunit b
MDMILTIFKSLGVDQTVFIQFVILIAIFFLVSNLLFSKLQEVLALREEKTTKLEGNAHAIYKQADELAQQYKAKVEKTHQDSHHANQMKKSEISNLHKEKIKKAEDEFSKEYEEKRKVILAEVGAQKATLMSKVDELSGSLVSKLTK